MLYVDRHRWTVCGWLVLPVPYCLYGVCCYLACGCGRMLPPPDDLCYGPMDTPVVRVVYKEHLAPEQCNTQAPATASP